MTTLLSPPFADEFSSGVLDSVFAASAAVQVPAQRILAEPDQTLDGLPALAAGQRRARQHVTHWAESVQPMLVSGFTRVKRFANLYRGLSEDDIEHLTSDLSSETGIAEFSEITRFFEDEADGQAQRLRQTAGELRASAAELINDSTQLREVAADAFERACAGNDRIAGILEQMSFRAGEATEAIAQASALAPTPGLAIAVGTVPAGPGLITTWLTTTGVGPVQTGLLQQHIASSEQYRALFTELQEIDPQCATLRWLLDDVDQLVLAGMEAASALAGAGQQWHQAAHYFGQLAEAAADGQVTREIAAASLTTMRGQVQELKETAEACECNSLIPVIPADTTVAALRLPSSWADQQIGADLFTAYLNRSRSAS